jgi:hypothetical protein
MSGGLLDALWEAKEIKDAVGCSFGEAIEAVQTFARWEREDLEAAEPESNVIYGVDFAKGR